MSDEYDLADFSDAPRAPVPEYARPMQPPPPAASQGTPAFEVYHSNPVSLPTSVSSRGSRDGNNFAAMDWVAVSACEEDGTVAQTDGFPCAPSSTAPSQVSTPPPQPSAVDVVFDAMAERVLAQGRRVDRYVAQRDRTIMEMKALDIEDANVNGALAALKASLGSQLGGGAPSQLTATRDVVDDCVMDDMSESDAFGGSGCGGDNSVRAFAVDAPPPPTPVKEALQVTLQPLSADEDADVRKMFTMLQHVPPKELHRLIDLTQAAASHMQEQAAEVATANADPKSLFFVSYEYTAALHQLVAEKLEAIPRYDPMNDLSLPEEVTDKHFTMLPLVDPVTLNGHRYERTQLRRWLSDHPNQDPISRETISPSDVKELAVDDKNLIEVTQEKAKENYELAQKRLIVNTAHEELIRYRDAVMNANLRRSTSDRQDSMRGKMALIAYCTKLQDLTERRVRVRERLEVARAILEKTSEELRDAEAELERMKQLLNQRPAAAEDATDVTTASAVDEKLLEMTRHRRFNNRGMTRHVDDNIAPQCTLCCETFNFVNRRHHCRICGNVFCIRCCGTLIRRTNVGGPDSDRGAAVRCCDSCYRKEMKLDGVTDIVEVEESLPQYIQSNAVGYLGSWIDQLYRHTRDVVIPNTLDGIARLRGTNEGEQPEE